jgi:hypothetical protein
MLAKQTAPGGVEPAHQLVRRASTVTMFRSVGTRNGCHNTFLLRTEHAVTAFAKLDQEVK